MKKFYFYSLVLFSCFNLLNGLNAQVKLKLSNVTGKQGDTVSVDLTADNFTELQAAQFSINYDSLIVAYIDIPANSKNSMFLPLTVGDHKTPPTSIKNGHLSFTWNNDAGGTTSFSNGTKLFSIRFRLIGNLCDSTLISFGTSQPAIEFTDKNGDPTTYNLDSKSKAKILGPNCMGGGGGPVDTSHSDFTFAAEKITINQGGMGCAKITVKNFKSIISLQGSLGWDKTKVRFKNITFPTPASLPDLTQGTFALSSDSSAIGWLWAPSNGLAVTLPDNAELFEICFTAIGPVGSSTNLTFGDLPVLIEVMDDNNLLTPKLETGMVSITNAGENMKLYYRDTMVTEKTELCIPIRVDNFSCMESFQFGVKFDTTMLKFKKPSNFNLPNFGIGNVNAVKDSVRVIWDEGTNGPQTLPDGSYVLYLCFDLIGPCPATKQIKFVDFNSGAIEFNNCRGILTTMVGEGTISIKCGVADPVCETSSTPETCYKKCDGKVMAIVTGGSGNFSFTWNKTAPVTMNNIGNTKDLTNLCGGSYRMIITDVTTGKNTVCPLAIVDSATQIEITNTVITHENVGNDGKIDITVSGGKLPYKYNWVKLPNTAIATTEDIMNLKFGNYRVSITDANGCTLLDTFRVDPVVLPLTCSINKTDSIKCFGECTGAFLTNVNGGTIQYTYKWNVDSTTNRIRNLCAGVYTVTVTDKNGLTSSCSVTLSQPPQLVITISNQTQGPGGTATGTASGGTAPYSYVWTDSTSKVISTSMNLTSADPGTYNLCVIDKNGCTECKTVVITKKGGSQTLDVTMTLDAGISCKGKCDGKIIVSANGTAPYTYKWSHDANLKTNIASNLCAGNYTVTVSDAAGNIKSSTLTIQDVSGVNVNLRKDKCATNNVDADGAYTAIVNGGTSPYTFSWCSGSSLQSATDLKSGSCSVTVTDRNGCTAVQNFTVCEGTTNPFDCYKGRLVISPNGDGYNETFEINCAINADNTLYIYDRWGNLVYGKVNYDNTWAGLDNDGKILNEGTYMWVLKVREVGKNDSFYKGTVTIVR